MKLKLSDWASIAEIVSSFAVVVTLILLLIELRENTAAIQAANQQSTAERIEARTITIATNPQLSRLTALVREPGGVEIGSDEAHQLRFVYVGLMTSAEESYLQYRQGFLEEDYFVARARRALVPPLSNPIGREYLREARENDIYVDEFLDWIDEEFGELLQ